MQSPAAAYIGAAIIASVFVAGTFGVRSAAYMHTLVALGAAPIIAHCVYGSSLLTRALSARWLVRLGVTSYAFYLWHLPILLALAWGTHWPSWATGILGLVLTVACSELSMRFIESPVLRLRDKIARPKSDGVPQQAKDETASQ
jgi:peptidoglycan/LPS O-acetylase OafA/YrhL